MKGWKIFVKQEGSPWQGPYHRCPYDWVIQKDSILEADLDPCIGRECGEGVNFWVEKDRALMEFGFEKMYCSSIILYEVETISEEEGDVVRPLNWKGRIGKNIDPADLSLRADKARAQKVKLGSVVKRWSMK